MRFLLYLLPSLLCAQTYDVVLQHGRVMDPESGLDAVRSVGIAGGKIVAISANPLRGKTEVDAAGLVIAPGFIDIHQPAKDINRNIKPTPGETFVTSLYDVNHSIRLS